MKQHKTNTAPEPVALAFTQVHQDLLLALLIVSLTVNLFVLVGWVTLQVTSVYDTQVASFLFSR